MNRIRSVVMAVAMSFVVAFALPVIAFADTPGAPDQPATMAGVRISAAIVTLLASQVVPVIVGWLSGVRWPSWLKRLLNIAINGGVNILSIAKLSDGTAVISKPMLAMWVLGTLASFVGYRELKAAGITSSRLDDGSPGKLAKVGVH